MSKEVSQAEASIPAEEKEAITTASKQTQTMEDLVLEELRVIKEKIASLEGDVNDPRNGLTGQLAKQTQRVDSLYTDIHGAVDGLKVRMSKAENICEENTNKLNKMEENCNRMNKLLAESKRLMQELQLMQGLVQKVTRKQSTTSSQILDLTRRGMEQNLIIHGIDDELEIQDPKQKNPMFTAKERPKHALLSFFKEQMNVDLSPEDVWKAHRTGPNKPGKVRPMITKLSYSAKDLIMENMGNLKGKKNPKTDQVFFISEQIPEGILENKKQTAERLKTLREANDKKENKDKIQVISDKILINDELDVPEITTPSPSELFVDPERQKEINTLQAKMCETDPIIIRNSQFIGVALKVHSVEDVKNAYIGVMQRYPAADHTMLAYAFKDKGRIKQGGCDDGEHGASTRIKKNIFEEKAKNTAVFILRSFGGVHIGFERFRTIDQVTKSALQLLAESL